MTYYTIDFDITQPTRHKLTVPTGSDFAVTINTYVGGRRCKTFAYKQGANTRIISEAQPNMTVDEINAWLVDSTAYKINSTAEAGLDCFTTLFVKGSEVEKSGVLTFWYDRLNVDNGAESALSTKMYNPKIYGYIEIQYVDFGKNCNGPDYKMDLIGPFSAKTLSSTALSADEVHVRNVSACVDVQKNTIVGQTVMPGGMISYLYNRNGMAYLSGNVYLGQDFYSKPSKTTSTNALYLDDFKHYLTVKEITVGSETLSVLQVASV